MKDEPADISAIPRDLKEAQTNGRLVIFVGAGVSKGKPSCLPTFCELSQKLAEKVGVPFYQEDDKPYDGFIGKLAEQNSNIHRWTQEIYGCAESKPTELHSLLLRLFQKPTDVRIVTTNYDRHLSTAFHEVFCEADKVSHFRAPALPVGNRFRGIVHLHGSVDQEPEELVLTDADFGRAYLTEGWARRFLISALYYYTVLYVGYSHEDPLLSYLALGLFPGSARFAFTREDKISDWRRLGVKAIVYPSGIGSERHRPLIDLISGWVERIEMSPISHLKRVRQIAETHNGKLPKPLSVEDNDYMIDVLRDDSTLQHFVRYARGRYWLMWLDRTGSMDNIFKVNVQLNRNEELLAGWFADNFVLSESEHGLEFLLRKGQEVHPILWSGMAWNLAHGKEIPEPSTFARWVVTLLNYVPQEGYRPDPLNHIMTRDFSEKYGSSVVLLFEFLTRPRLILKPAFTLEPQEKQERVDVEISMAGDTFNVREAWDKRLRPLLSTLAGELASILTSHLRRAWFLLVAAGEAGQILDTISWSRSAIEEHEQDRHKFGFEILIDFARDTIEFLLKNDTDHASALIYEWSASGVLILQRLAIHGVKMSSYMSPDEKLQWLIARDWLYTHGLKHEVFQLLASAFPDAGESVQVDIVRMAQRGPKRSNDDERDADTYEVYNLLFWLADKAPDCKAAQEAFSTIQSENPRFKPRDHADLDVWTSGLVYIGGDSPIKAEDLLSKEPSEWVDYLLSYEGDRFEGPYREALMNCVGQAAKKKPAWGLGLAIELQKKRIWKKDLWEALLYAWDEAHFDEKEWDKVLEILNADEVLERFARRVSSILWNGAEKRRIPVSLLDKAEETAEQVWTLSDRLEPEQDLSDDWLFEAINHPAGQLTLFWLHAMSIRLESVNQDEKVIPETYRSRLTSIVVGTSYACQLGRIIVASQIKFLFSLDRDWTRDNLLPLLDWTIDPGRAEQCWHGFIAWGEPSREILEDVKPLYENAIAEFPSEPSHLRENLIRHVAIIARSLENPLEGGWLNNVIGHLKKRQELSTWATTFRYRLAPLSSEVKEAIWGTWLEEYWSKRIDGIPFDLEDDELRNMYEWALELEPVFDQVVDMICRSPVIDPGHTAIYRDLRRKELAKSHPVSVSKFFLHLLKGIKGLLAPHLYGDMAGLIEELRDSGAPMTNLKEAVEELARIGCPLASDLGDSLDK